MESHQVIEIKKFATNKKYMFSILSNNVRTKYYVNTEKGRAVILGARGYNASKNISNILEDKLPTKVKACTNWQKRLKKKKTSDKENI